VYTRTRFSWEKSGRMGRTSSRLKGKGVQREGQEGATGAVKAVIERKNFLRGKRAIGGGDTRR